MTNPNPARTPIKLLYRTLTIKAKALSLSPEKIYSDYNSFRKYVIDKAIEDAPAKLKVSVNVSDDDWPKIQEMLNKQREWLINQAQTTVQTVNVMLAEERTKVRDRYKEYDGCYLGHYGQWLFWFFFVLGYFLFTSGIVMMVGKYFNWF